MTQPGSQTEEEIYKCWALKENDLKNRCLSPVHFGSCLNFLDHTDKTCQNMYHSNLHLFSSRSLSHLCVRKVKRVVAIVGFLWFFFVNTYFHMGALTVVGFHMLDMPRIPKSEITWRIRVFIYIPAVLFSQSAQCLFFIKKQATPCVCMLMSFILLAGFHGGTSCPKLCSMFL